MATDSSDARWARPRRMLRRVRNLALVAVFVAPLAQAAWAVHVAGVGTDAPGVIAPATEGPGVSAREADYFARRQTVIDELLPEGSGGMRFYENLGDAAGLAFVDRAAIGLSASVDLGAFPEAVELHERAHLAHAFLPDLVAALMAKVPAAAAGEYAATDPGEHFGEMAAKAWELVAPPQGLCVDRTPEVLEATEGRVPGTAGFVAHFLRHGGFDEVGFLPMADRLSAPYRAELDAIWRAIEIRRRPDGGFRPWRHDTMRAFLEARRARLRMSGHWLDRLSVVVLQPSLLLVRLAG